MYCAFYKSTKLSDVTLKNGLKVVPRGAFTNCTAITSINIPDSVDTIKSSAFYNCSSLETVYIGNGVKKMESNAFLYCKNLKNVHVDDISVWLNITFNTADSNPLYYAENLYVNGVVLQELNVPGTVTAIKEYAFYNYAKLSKVTLPQGLTKLGNHAFYKSSVKEIFIPKTVTSIYRPFGENEVLEKVVFEEGISKITSYAFESCKALTSVVIPEGVTEIATDAFDNCVKLQNVVLPQSLVTIGNYAFYGCDSITEIVIPDAVTNIGTYAFCSCDKLENVTIGKSVKKVYIDAFYSSGIKNVYAYDLSSWAQIDFGGGSANPTYHGGNLHLGGELIGSEILIPEGVTRIGSFAFYGFKNITSVKLSSTVVSVNKGAFYGCENLGKIELSDGVTSIGDYAFEGCTGLTDVYAYDLASWLKISFGNKTSTPLYYAQKLFIDGKEITEAEISESVTDIKNYAFYNCNSITSVSVGKQVKSIGASAFENCNNLKTVSLENGLEIIEDSAFAGCTSLENIVIPDTVIYLYSGAFGGCTSLKSAILGDGIKYISYCLFENCTSLVNIEIPRGVKEIYGNSFAGCTALESAVIDDNVIYIGYGVFSNCPALTIYGILNTAAHEFAFDNNIPFEELKNLATVELHGDNGVIDEGYNVEWKNINGETVSVGKYFRFDEAGVTYSYRINLNEELATVYKTPAEGQFVTAYNADPIKVTLEKYPLVTVSGTITDIEENKLSGVTVKIKQVFLEKYNKETVLTTDENGAFTADVPMVDAAISYQLNGYYQRSRNVVFSEDTFNASTVLTKLPENKVGLVLSVKTTVADGEERTLKSIGSFDGLAFTVYNETQDKAISDFVIQYPYIIFEDADVNSADEITICVADNNKKMSSGSVTVTLDENKKGAGEIEFSENGKISVENVYGCEEINFTVFDSNGKRITSEIVKASEYEVLLTDALPDGDYKILFNQHYNVLKKINSIDSLNKFGLKKGEDYIVEDASVANGKISVVKKVDVPEIDAEKFIFTVKDSTGFVSLNTSVTDGQYVTLKAYYKIDSKYPSSSQYIQFEIPETVQFVENSVAIGKKRVSYTYENNVLTVYTNKSEETVRFYIIPIVSAEHSINAIISFNYNGNEASQPIGTATVTSSAGEIKAKSETGSKTIPVSGKAVPDSKVTIYDNGKELKTVTANKVGDWATEIEMVDTFSYSQHAIYAEYQLYGVDTPIMSEVKAVEYNINKIDLKGVTMTNQRGSTYLDFSTPPIGKISYLIPVDDDDDDDEELELATMEMNEYTFTVDFTDNDPERISDVYVVVGFVNHPGMYIPCKYNGHNWTATLGLMGSNAMMIHPTSVNAVYDVKDDDKIIIDNDAIAAGEEYLEELQGMIDEAKEYGELEHEEFRLSDVYHVYSDEFLEEFEYNEETGTGTKLVKFAVDSQELEGEGYSSMPSTK